MSPPLHGAVHGAPLHSMRCMQQLYSRCIILLCPAGSLRIGACKAAPYRGGKDRTRC